jgi:ubiquinol-cytochrome c reductase cytochrome b subunit
LLFAVQAVTGMILAFYYNPSPEQAYTSINFIMNDVAMGGILRGIHHWGASAMVILVFIHLASNFFSGAFKAPREVTWIIGIALFLLTLGFGFTGYLLPWDQKAYWATVVSANIPRDIPLVGKFIARLMLGGDTVSGLTLTRFYAIHTLLLPALTAFFILFHIYLVRVHDIVGHGEEKSSEEEKTYRFFPEHLFRCSVAFGVVICIIFFLAIFADVPLENVAGTVDPTYLPRPEWYYMWLFQLLTFFPGKFEIFGSLVIPIGVIIILFCLPFLSKTDLRGMAERPLATAVGVTCLVGVVYLTLMGFEGARSYGDVIVVPDRKLTQTEQKGLKIYTDRLMGFEGARSYGNVVVVPDRQLTQTEQKGLKIYTDRECAYCHNIIGRGGRLQGPDLSNVVVKNRTKEWLRRFIKDPQAISPWSIMPKYDLSQEELSDLSDFILSLDFDSYGAKRISRQEVIGEK